jgi:SAM-dependent methyltransferase
MPANLAWQCYTEISTHARNKLINTAMQTPAERHLIEKILTFLKNGKSDYTPLLLNIGASKSLVIEKALYKVYPNFICDRIDVQDCEVSHPVVRNSFVASVESMPMISSGQYDACYSNFVLEHVENIDEAAQEVSRILRPGGTFVFSIPNPNAPEFFLSRHTPLWFHQFIKGKGEGMDAYETHYAFNGPRDLIALFEKYGFALDELKFFPFTYGYLYRFPILAPLSKLYDRLVEKTGNVNLMGNVCVTLRKSTA